MTRSGSTRQQSYRCLVEYKSRRGKASAGTATTLIEHQLKALHCALERERDQRSSQSVDSMLPGMSRLTGPYCCILSLSASCYRHFVHFCRRCPSLLIIQLIHLSLFVRTYIHIYIYPYIIIFILGRPTNNKNQHLRANISILCRPTAKKQNNISTATSVYLLTRLLYSRSLSRWPVRASTRGARPQVV